MPNVKEIGEVDMVSGISVIYHITVGHMEFGPTQALTIGTLQRDIIITQFDATRCRVANATEPIRSGRYLLVIRM